MTYDESKGTFRTPLGIVTQDALDEARTLLNELVPFVEKSKYQDSVFIDKLQQYIQLIPRKVGRKLIAEEIFPDMDTFQKEGQILDALDASLQEVLTSSDDKDKDKPKEAKIFNVKLDVLEDKKDFKRIEELYDKTRDRRHTSYKLQIKKIYTVSIKHMYDAFEKYGKSVGNIMELYHGTRTENLLSILKNGLVIPKSSASHVTGRLMGDGAYFSDIATKSLNYAQGYWGHGTTDNNCFMLLCSVAMGKFYVPNGTGESLPKQGYNSTFAKAHKSGVLNNEMIVYNVNQCNLNYLIEFSDK
jgi:poly [ADP-ribose] polymerase